MHVTRRLVNNLKRLKYLQIILIKTLEKIHSKKEKSMKHFP